MLVKLSTKNGFTMECTCNFKATRNGFKHYGDVYLNDSIYKCNNKELKICYINRTWEAYEYQSLLSYMIEYLKKNKLVNEVDYKELKNKVYNHAFN